MTSGEQIVHILKSYVLKSFTIGFGILLVVILIWLLQGFMKGPYWNAKRARSAGDIRQATRLFEDAVREDAKGLSFKALLTLMEMNELQALERLIALMDLPDLNWIVPEDRKRMCDVIRKRTVGTTADVLPLDPYASEDVREQQRLQWKRLVQNFTPIC